MLLTASSVSDPDPHLLGGKAATLARLAVAGLSSPVWIAVTPAAFAAARAQDTAAEWALPADLAAELDAWLVAHAPPGTLWAVRSSAADEDGGESSFAGQLSSFLNVARADVPARVVDVWRSAFTPHLLAYRRERGLQGPPAPPAVLIQRMVPAQAAGIAFSADPVSGRRGVAVVAAVRGLGAGLATGAQSGDAWHVDRDGVIIQATLLDAAAPVLPESTVQAVAALARACAARLGRPQDIEWAWDGAQVHLLQSRPITTLGELSDPDGVYTLWDNSNIVESYGGTTTPLTYSFARRAYQEVYQELCRILGVPRGMIAARSAVFANLIGYIRGRIYYNLLNWYRVLALLPGFKANRSFMEQMMGVKESLPAEIVADLAAATWQDRLLDRLRLGRAMLGLVVAYATLGRRRAAFYARLDNALGQMPDLSRWRADELVAYYRRLESELLPRWDAPLVNDFFAMIFYGVLRKLTGAWCGDAAGTLQNDLLTGQGGMISAEPAALVRELARLAQDVEATTPGFVARLCSGSLSDILPALEGQPAFAAAYRAYLERFGERCLNELKLESATLHDDPLPLLRAVGRLAAGQGDDLRAHRAEGGDSTAAQAEARAAQAMSGKPLRRVLFGWVLAQARERVRDRENLRFERTRVFGRARRVLHALGERLYAAGALDDPADVFYLEVAEVTGWVEGTVTCTNLRGLVGVRKVEAATWATLPAPPPRFATFGGVYEGNRFAPLTPPIVLSGELQRGIGASPGRVQGRARVVRNPLDAALVQGDIVVAEHTDPSWILILPLASALVVARGSLLSHAAIVARELGIPAVVGLSGAPEWLRDGDQVEVDGAAGTVRRLGGGDSSLR